MQIRALIMHEHPADSEVRVGTPSAVFLNKILVHLLLIVLINIMEAAA